MISVAVVVEQVSILVGSTCCFVGSLLGNGSRIEVCIVVDTHRAMTDDYKEKTADQEEYCQSIANNWLVVSHKEGGCQENVKVPFTSSGFQE